MVYFDISARITNERENMIGMFLEDLERVNDVLTPWKQWGSMGHYGYGPESRWGVNALFT